MIFLTMASLSYADVFLTRPDGTLYGPYSDAGAANAPADRKVPYDGRKMPLTDRRGCSRWRWDGSRIVAISAGDRKPDIDVQFAAWKAWREMKVIADLETAIGLGVSNPALYQRIQEEVARLFAEYEQATRAGTAGDEP